MIGRPVAPKNAIERRSLRLESFGAASVDGRPRTTNRTTRTSGRISEQDRVCQQGGEVERHARVDEEDRNEEAEGDGLHLALDRLPIGLLGVAHEQPPDDAGRERTQQHVEVEHDAERDEGREDQEAPPGSRTAPRCAASS